MEVLPSGGSSTVNGNFQFLGSILSYNENVVKMLRSERIRIDTGILFPELVNMTSVWIRTEICCGGISRKGISMMCVMTANAIANITVWPQAQGTGTGAHYDLAAFRTDNMNFAGEYDVTLRLPAVPAGQYEIRIGYVCNIFMGIAQIYFGQNLSHMQPTGIPLNLGLIGSSAKVSMITDNAYLMTFIMICRIM